MMSEKSSGIVQTVLGPVNGDALGYTLVSDRSKYIIGEIFPIVGGLVQFEYDF